VSWTTVELYCDWLHQYFI